MKLLTDIAGDRVTDSHGNLMTTTEGIVACLGDPSSHGGHISDTGGNTNVKVGGILVAINGASHSCPIPLHGTTAITAITTKTYVDGKLVITYGARARCGAIIRPPSRSTYAE